MIRFLFMTALAVAAAAAAPASACTATTPVTTTYTSVSAASIKAGMIPPAQLKSFAGLTCNASTLVLLGNNAVKAKFNSGNGLVLQRVGGGGSLAYTASAAPNGGSPFTQNGTVDYMQNNLLNALGLLSTTSAELPFYIKPAIGTAPVNGTYKDRITLTWDWYLCPSLGIGTLCATTPNQGTATVIVDIVLVVEPKLMTMSISSVTTWDPVNLTSNPKALPGSKRRATLSVANPDLVPMDSNTVTLAMAVPARQSLLLDGDGASSNVFVFSNGVPSSALSFTYSGPSSASDDVEFSSDGGATWAFAPSVATASSVTNVRLKPKGAMAAGSTFTLSAPFLLR